MKLLIGYTFFSSMMNFVLSPLSLLLLSVKAQPQLVRIYLITRLMQNLCKVVNTSHFLIVVYDQVPLLLFK